MRIPGIVVSLLLPMLASACFAQPFPSRPVKFVVPFTAGSASDILARTVGEKLAKAWGQPVLIDNRPGAGGTIGTALVAHAPPDGYTLLVASAGHVVNPVLYPALSYDSLADFTAVVPLADLPSVLTVSANSKIQSVADLLRFAQGQPGALNYCSGGVGSASHVSAERFRVATGIAAVHVPLKGAPEMVTEIMTERVHFGFLPLLAAMPSLRDGRLRALAVSSAHRSAALPNVPTLAEAGVHGAEFDFWIGVLATRQTPPDLVAKLNRDISAALQLSDVRERLGNLGAEPMPMSQTEFDAYFRRQYEELGAFMRKAGVRAQQ